MMMMKRITETTANIQSSYCESGSAPGTGNATITMRAPHTPPA